ncbi:hypothetical protein [Halalkalibacter hemicellulosilyticus]|uniref:Uncharacterized protein n=1 Tax=Halalkalibacter hemicellulosilyticusJCM 9152 TaxID=1236971 RepID=W4QIA9_9BACI|nr:hypothetical protein [Halalkalibacter hemicellulosilyticus]GAE31632.1 hypothetical protein JCM9152_3111 [Halalkalibacter hemicellulosilyticusJCM 9152]
MTEQNYDATYKLGKTVVHVISPGELTPEELQKRIKDYHLAGWSAWNSLTPEQQKALNKEAQDESEDSS